jgi:hypothetical protein
VLSTLAEITTPSPCAPREGDLATIVHALRHRRATPDAERNGRPPSIPCRLPTSWVGLNTWDLDAIRRDEHPGWARPHRHADGPGVTCRTRLRTARLWRQYFPQERIATQSRWRSGAAAMNGGTSRTLPTCGSTIRIRTARTSRARSWLQPAGTPINGVAPAGDGDFQSKCSVQNGSGWSVGVASGNRLRGEFEGRPLAGSPVVHQHEPRRARARRPFEQAAIDYANRAGCHPRGSAGNRGTRAWAIGRVPYGHFRPRRRGGLANGFPARTATGPTGGCRTTSRSPNPADFYMPISHSRELAGRTLTWRPGFLDRGAYQLQSGKTELLSSPRRHVDGQSARGGIVALMAQKARASRRPSRGHSRVHRHSSRRGDAGRSRQTDRRRRNGRWEATATGSGLAVADAALAATA